MWIDDLATVLVSAGVGVLNTNIFLTSKANLPSGNGPYISIIETSGTGPDNIQNALLPGYEYPGAQILVRGSEARPVITKIHEVWRAVASVRNQYINGVWYRDIHPQQNPYDLGVDDTGGRIHYAFNVIGDKSLL
jgi:hypothetical protein